MSYDRFTEILEKRGPLFLLGTALLVGFSLWGILKADIETDFTVFMPTRSEQSRRLQKTGELFGDTDQILILLESDGTLDDLRASAQYIEPISRLPGVSSCEGALPLSMLSMEDEKLEQYIEAFQGDDRSMLFAPRKEGGFWITLRANLRQDVRSAELIESLEEVLNGTDRDYLLSGEPYLQGKIFHYILRILIMLPPTAIFLLLLVFRLRIGSLRATFLSMIPAVIGGILTLGTICWVLGGISVMSALVPLFIIVLGSADGLHVTSHVMDRLSEGKSNREAVSETLKAVGVPIIMTSVTTMAGFLSMLLIDSSAIREMGIGASWGILLAGAATWFVLPVLLLHLKPLRRKNRTTESALLSFLRKTQGKTAFVITLAILAVSLPGLSMLKSDFSMLTIYKKSTEVRIAIDKTTEALGGALPVMLLYKSDAPLDGTAAAAVLEFQRKAESEGITSRGMSLFKAVENFAAMRTGKREYPDNPLVLRMILASMEKLNPALLVNFHSDEGYGRAYFFLPDLSDETLNAFTDLARTISETSGVELQPVGTAFAMKEMNDQIIPQQIQSLILAVILVMILSSLTQKSLKLGLLSGVPIAVTLAGLYGYMGYAGISMSVITGIMTGLTVGVGIDYAIHFVSLYRYSRNAQDPAGRALEYVATPVLANAMGLAIGFTAMMLSPFQIHVTLSSLMWVTMVLSAFLSLSLLPSLLRKLP